MTINYELNVFKTLTDKYKTWNELQQYLESEDGGLFKVVDTAEEAFEYIQSKLEENKPNF